MSSLVTALTPTGAPLSADLVERRAEGGTLIPSPRGGVGSAICRTLSMVHVNTVLLCARGDQGNTFSSTALPVAW
eukprot:3671714-Pyramimonas_sp.AAC.1